MEELKFALQQAKNSAPGHDNLHYSMIRHLSDRAQNFLLHLYNQIWLLGEFPIAWRRAIVICFCKPNKDPTNTSSYRPIALTSALCKLLEKIINARLTYYLEENNYLSPNQYGFRKDRSCVDSLARLETDILETLARKEHLVAIFFDISKAYDTTWRFHILRKLKAIDILGQMGFFIQNFLCNRVFNVRVGKYLSELHEQEQGVPQGSIMSVTLFALAINDIVSEVSEDVCKSLYVDDLAIYYSSANINTIQRKLQIAINKINRWTSSHGFRLSQEKSVAIHFHNKRGMQQEPILHLSGNNIQFKTSTKFLGLIFDQKLSWEHHIKALKTKCLGALSLLKHLAHSDWGADRSTLLHLYRSVIRSKLDYGSHIYGSAKPYIINKLNAIHHAALRLCTGAFRTSPIPSLLVDAGEQSLQRRRLKIGLQHYLRLQRMTGTVAHQTVFDEQTHHVFQIHQDLRAPMAVRMERTITLLNMQHFRVIPQMVNTEPPWRLCDCLCSELFNIRKADYTPQQLVAIVNDHLETSHSDSHYIYTDGSHTDEGSGYAFVSSTYSTSVKISNEASSFTAELLALEKAITSIEGTNHNEIVILSDCRSAIQLVNKMYTKHPIAASIQSALILYSAQGITIKFCWIPSHIGIRENEEADRMAREAANSNAMIAVNEIPHKDYYPHIKKLLIEDWQREWDGFPLTNKLKNIKNTVRDWNSSYQKVHRHETILTRLRIGHSLLTHGHLMDGRGIPCYCDNCLVPMTVNHFLVECPDYQQERFECFQSHQPSLSSLLSEIEGETFNATRVITYLSRIGLLNKI